jgi:hypothetical protein
LVPPLQPFFLQEQVVLKWTELGRLISLQINLALPHQVKQPFLGHKCYLKGCQVKTCQGCFDSSRDPQTVVHAMHNFRRRRRNTSALVLLLLILFSLLLGWGLTHLVPGGNRFLVAQAAPQAGRTVGTVDVVPPEYEVGQQLYLESCGSCHLALPPQIMPTQTWQQLLQDPNHYGARLQLPVNPQLQYIWSYLQLFSRPLRDGELVPYRLERSRYLKILHPNVQLPQGLTAASCVSCHPGAADYNFRSLGQQWQAP